MLLMYAVGPFQSLAVFRLFQELLEMDDIPKT